MKVRQVGIAITLTPVRHKRYMQFLTSVPNFRGSVDPPSRTSRAAAGRSPRRMRRRLGQTIVKLYAQRNETQPKNARETVSKLFRDCFVSVSFRCADGRTRKQRMQRGCSTRLTTCKRGASKRIKKKINDLN